MGYIIWVGTRVVHISLPHLQKLEKIWSEYAQLAY